VRVGVKQGNIIADTWQTHRKGNANALQIHGTYIANT
jgi:hypothetical protein